MPERSALDRLMTADRPFLTESGLETTMLFHEGLDLPHFSAAPLLDSAEGRAALGRFYDRHAAVAERAGTGLVIDTVTWRAGSAWVGALGWQAAEVATRNAAAVAFARGVAAANASRVRDIVISGTVGPAGDGYAPGAVLGCGEAREIHRAQVHALAGAGADLITALTMTQATEAAAIAALAAEAGKPSIVSFTVETDGHLPTGQALPEAIAEVEETTAGAPLFYMINCAHPDHFRSVLDGEGAWRARIGGIRANASRLSHAELDAAATLDEGDPAELAALYAALFRMLPGLRAVGGCCGTDHRHVGCIADAVIGSRAAA